MNIRLMTLLGIVTVVSLFRLVPHPPNFTPVMAVALFSGAHFIDRRAALLVPLAAMLLADLFIGFHDSMLFVYIGVAVTVLFGLMLRQKRSIIDLFTVTVASSAAFFLISNFGAWLVMPELYPRSLFGLNAAYIAAIPFYQNSLAADLIYTTVLFAGFEFAQRRFDRLQLQA